MQQNERDPTGRAFAEAINEIRKGTAGEFFASVREVIGRNDLTLAQLATLLLLADKEPRPVKEIAERLGRSMSATSRMLDNLVKIQLIKRREDPEDRRVRLVVIAAGGVKLMERLIAARAEAQLSLLKELTAEEREVVVRGMSLLAEAARRRRDGR